MSHLPASETEIEAELSPARQWTVLGVLMLAVLVISIDNTVLGFAVPSLSEDLKPSATELLWIVDAYAFVLAGLLITMGNLGDRIGRRRLLMIGAAGFAAASTLAAFSTSPAMLIGARALLGVAGATLMPSTLSIIRTAFPDANRRRMAIALWTSGFAVGSALGPIVGGWLLQHVWWGAVFLLAVPVMALLLVVGRFILPESRNPDPGPLDLTSSALSLGAVLPVVYAMKKAAEHGPSPELLALALVGVVIGVVFVRRQRGLDEPMLDVSLFSNRPFSTAIVTNLLANFAFIGSIFLLAQYLQLVLDLDPMAAGLHMLPGMTAAFLASIGTAAVLKRVRPGVAVAVAMTAAAIGYLLLFRLSGAGDGHWVTLAMMFIGAGAGAASSLGANLVMAIVPARRAGSASAISETSFELGAATGIALLGSVVSAVYRRQVEVSETIDPEMAQRAGDTLAEAVQVSKDVPDAAGSALLESAFDAFASGLHSAGAVGATLLIIGAAAAVIALRKVAAGIEAADH